MGITTSKLPPVDFIKSIFVEARCLDNKEAFIDFIQWCQKFDSDVNEKNLKNCQILGDAYCFLKLTIWRNKDTMKAANIGCYFPGANKAHNYSVEEIDLLAYGSSVKDIERKCKNLKNYGWPTAYWQQINQPTTTTTLADPLLNSTDLPFEPESSTTGTPIWLILLILIIVAGTVASVGLLVYRYWFKRSDESTAANPDEPAADPILNQMADSGAPISLGQSAPPSVRPSNVGASRIGSRPALGSSAQVSALGSRSAFGSAVGSTPQGSALGSRRTSSPKSRKPRSKSPSKSRSASRKRKK